MDNIREDAIKVINEILEKSKITEGDIFIVGCSSSEMIGNRMGTSKDGQTDDAVNALYDVISTALKKRGINMAAVKHYNNLSDPVVVENIKQKAMVGLDIGGVMIGMHIHPVVVPIRLENKKIGKAGVIAGRYRPKYVGGQRAVYDPTLA